MKSRYKYFSDKLNADDYEDSGFEKICDRLYDWVDDAGSIDCSCNYRLSKICDVHMNNYFSVNDKASSCKRSIRDWLISVFIMILFFAAAIAVIYVDARYNSHTYITDLNKSIGLKAIDFILGIWLFWFTLKYSQYLYRLSAFQWGTLVYTSLGIHVMAETFWLYSRYPWRMLQVVTIISLLMYVVKSVNRLSSENNYDKARDLLKFLVNILLMSTMFVSMDYDVLVALLHVTVILFGLYTRRYYLSLRLLIADSIAMFALMFVSVDKFWWILESLHLYGYSRSLDGSYQKVNALKVIESSGIKGNIFANGLEGFHIPEALSAYPFAILLYAFGGIGMLFIGIVIILFIRKMVIQTKAASSLIESDTRAIFGIFIMMIFVLGMITGIGMLSPNNIGIPVLGDNAIWLYITFFTYGVMVNSTDQKVELNVNRSLLIQGSAFVFCWVVVNYIYRIIV